MTTTTVKNMDVSMELDSLKWGLHFDEVNIPDGLPSPPHSDNLHFVEVASHLPHEPEQPGGEEVQSSVAPIAAPLPTHNNPDVELAQAVVGEAHINGSTAVSEAFAAITVSQVPVDPIAEVSAPTQPRPMLMCPPTLPLSLEEWFSRGISVSLQAPPNQLHHLLSSQHENMPVPQDMDISKQHDTNNQIMLGKKMAAHNSSSWGINQQQLPSQTSSIFQRNPTERGLGFTGTGTLNQGQLLSNQPTPTMLNTTWTGYLLSPLPNVLDLLCAPNSLPFDTPAIYRPQQSSLLTAQGNHIPTRHIFDLLKTMQPPSTTYSNSYSRPEFGSIYRSTSAPVPPNTSDYQPAVQKLLLPEPAVSFRPTILSANYHPQPATSFSLILNSFGAIPTVPQRYPDCRDYERSYLQSQRTRSHFFAHQAPGLTPSSGSPPVSDNSDEFNQLLSRLSVHGSSPFPGPTSLPKVPVSNMQSSMMVEPSQPISIAPDASDPSSLLGFKTPDLPKPSWIPNSSSSQLQNLAPASTDTLTANPNSGDFVTLSSSTRPPVSNRVRRILDMGSTPPGSKTKATSCRKARSSLRSASRTNSQPIQIPRLQDPVDKWMKELERELNKSWDPSKATKKKAASRSARGSPRQHEGGESSSSKRRKRNSAEKENEDAPPIIPDEALDAREYEVDVLQDPNAPEFSGQREADNTIYDINYRDVAAPTDPHVRFYWTVVRRNRG